MTDTKTRPEMEAWTLKVQPELLADIKSAADEDGFRSPAEWVRVQLRRLLAQRVPAEATR